MNYIKQLTLFFNKAAADPKLSPTHMSLFLALFQTWNQARFPKKITIIRDDIMHLSKIHSKATYHKAMAYLHSNQYINYQPSYNPLKGSEIDFFPKKTTNQIATNEPVQILNTKPINEPSNKLYTNIIQDNICSHTSVKKNVDASHKSKQSNPYTAAQNEFLLKNKETEIPPAQGLVEEYFINKKSDKKEALKFFNHYTANGWLVGGKSPMKNWKASANNWLANSSKFETNGNNKYGSRAKQLHTKPTKNYFEPL